MIQFPNPNSADDDGLLAQGGELSPDYLLSAYAQGIFPWFNEGEPILWWSPNPRMVLYPKKFKISKSFKQVLNKHCYEIRIDTRFDAVIKACSTIPRQDQEGTWITHEMIEAYNTLHKMGFAHSFETYLDDELVGGLYGISLGNIFFGESMFHRKTDASKFSLYHLVQYALKNNFTFIDVQQSTPHLKSLGAEEIERQHFLEVLSQIEVGTTQIGKWKTEAVL